MLRVAARLTQLIRTHFARTAPCAAAAGPECDWLASQFAELEHAIAERERRARQAACTHQHGFAWTFGARAPFCLSCFYDGLPDDWSYGRRPA
jgi:hypothetical protein